MKRREDDGGFHNGHSCFPHPALYSDSRGTCPLAWVLGNQIIVVELQVHVLVLGFVTWVLVIR